MCACCRLRRWSRSRRSSARGSQSGAAPKRVVAAGLLSLAAGLAWTSSASASTSYLVIAGQMVLIGSGIGLTSAPATESIMGAVPAAKAGVGSAINDATRILGGTLGVAVIGSIYASLYDSRLADLLGARIPSDAADAAHSSVGSAFGAAAELEARGHTGVARALHDSASTAFFHGFGAACLVAAGVAVGGILVAVLLLPARPRDDAPERTDDVFLPAPTEEPA